MAGVYPRAANDRAGRTDPFRRFARPSLPLFAALLLVFSLSIPIAPARGAPLEIASDTIWEGTVEIADEVRVLKGATLLIQPGTTVRFSPEKDASGDPKARLFVNGTLIAQGTPGQPIVFGSASRDPQPGDWGGIVLENSFGRTNRLTNVRIRDALTGVSGSRAILLVEDAVISGNLRGVYAYQEFKGWIFRSTISGNDVGLHFHQSSGFEIENCEISGNKVGGIVCVLGSSPTVRLSKIFENGGKGISCLQGSSPLIGGNTIRGHREGIHLELQSRPRIVNNLITENTTGISGEKMVFPQIQGNVITANETGIYCNYSAYMEIHENNIHANRVFDLVLGDNMSILMQNKIPFRFLGQHYFEAPPPEVQDLPHQTQRFQPFPENSGVVDARGNWWGKLPTEEMEKLGGDGNISVIEDFFDKPETYYEVAIYRRDRVAFAPWEKQPLPEAGPPAPTYSAIAGKVVFEGRPLAGVRVHAYDSAAGAFRGEGYAFSAPSSPDGSFALNLKPGTYYLVAKGPVPPFPHAEPGGGAYFGYYGGNPVALGAGAVITNNIQVVPRRIPVVTEGGPSGKGRIEGVVLGPGGPAAGAALHVYADASRQFRGPDLFGPQGAIPGGTDEKGSFAIELPEGTYHLVASQRRNHGTLGPLRPGDLHGYFDGNPLTVTPGTKTTIAVRMVEKLRETASPGTPTSGDTGIRGKVTDPSGTVPAGVYAFATTDPSFMIGAMPPHRSPPIGADGSFFVDLPAGGTYYVSARSGYGGPPLPGEWHGFYGEKTPRPIIVETNRVTEGIDFVIKKME